MTDTVSPLLDLLARIGPEHPNSTIYVRCDAGAEPAITAGISQEETAHDTLRRVHLEQILQQEDSPLLGWVRATPYLCEPIRTPGQTPSDPQARSECAILSLLLGPKGVTQIRLQISLPWERTDTHRALQHSGFSLKCSRATTERALRLLTAIKGPFHAFETQNTNNQTCSFKSPDDLDTIALLDRLFRAPGALLGGKEGYAPTQPLTTIARMCVPRAQQAFPPHLAAILAT